MSYPTGDLHPTVERKPLHAAETPCERRIAVLYDVAGSFGPQHACLTARSDARSVAELMTSESQFKGEWLMSAEEEVREASSKFYAALSSMLNGDAGPLAGIWSHSATVTTMHPIGGREVGWDQVRKSWQQVAQISSGGQGKLVDQVIRIVGDLAYELGVERGQVTLAGQQVTIDHRVTNIYRREGGAWKVVHHHTDVAPAMLDVVNRLKAKT
jgi:ketosteroid isomerase-like protein